MKGLTIATLVAVLATCLLVIVVIVSGSAPFVQPVAALPLAQGDCTADRLVVTPDEEFVPLRLKVEFESRGDRKAILLFSGDMNVEPEAEMRLAISIDGGFPLEYSYGPSNIANNQEFNETRMAMNLIDLPAGSHTIEAFVRVYPAPGSSGTQEGIVQHPCLAVMGRTS
jgi:hypothetical protein